MSKGAARRFGEAFKALIEQKRKQRGETIEVGVVTTVLANNRYLLYGGANVGVTGRRQYKTGDVVYVLVRKKVPLAILGHHVKRAKGGQMFKAAFSDLEELLSYGGSVYLRTGSIATKLALGPIISEAGLSDLGMVGIAATWGEDKSSFVVGALEAATNTPVYVVFRMPDRPWLGSALPRIQKIVRPADAALKAAIAAANPVEGVTINSDVAVFNTFLAKNGHVIQELSFRGSISASFRMQCAVVDLDERRALAVFPPAPNQGQAHAMCVWHGDAFSDSTIIYVSGTASNAIINPVPTGVGVARIYKGVNMVKEAVIDDMYDFQIIHRSLATKRHLPFVVRAGIPANADRYRDFYYWDTEADSPIRVTRDGWPASAQASHNYHKWIGYKMQGLAEEDLVFAPYGVGAFSDPADAGGPDTRFLIRSDAVDKFAGIWNFEGEVTARIAGTPFQFGLVQTSDFPPNAQVAPPKALASLSGLDLPVVDVAALVPGGTPNVPVARLTNGTLVLTPGAAVSCQLAPNFVKARQG